VAAFAALHDFYLFGVSVLAVWSRQVDESKQQESALRTPSHTFLRWRTNKYSILEIVFEHGGMSYGFLSNQARCRTK